MGRPLIMANPNLLVQTVSTTSTRTPTSLDDGETLTQSFTADAPFSSVGARRDLQRNRFHRDAFAFPGR